MRASSRSDPLTGVANSRVFLELLKREIARARRYKRPLTLAYLDLDNFKSVNDILGHAMGDKVLQTVVSTVNANIRVTDVVGRLGGDEFVLLLPETDMQGARSGRSCVRSEVEGQELCELFLSPEMSCLPDQPGQALAFMDERRLRV